VVLLTVVSWHLGTLEQKTEEVVRKIVGTGRNDVGSGSVWAICNVKAQVLTHLGSVVCTKVTLYWTLTNKSLATALSRFTDEMPM